MIRWEYQASYLFGDLNAVMEQLADLGAEGWELVQLNGECSDGGSRVFLKRMIRPDPPVLVADADFMAMTAHYENLSRKLFAVAKEAGVGIDDESSVRLTKFEVHLLGSLVAEELGKRRSYG